MRVHGFVVRPNLAVVAGVFFLLLIASSAVAQTTAWNDRAFLNVNMTLQVTSTPFDEGLAPVIYAERAVLTATHTGEAGTLTIEPAGGVRIWRNLGAGGALGRRSATETTTVRALVPHPVLFNQPRLGAKDAPFERSELAVHAQALFMVPIHPRLDVLLSAGPSFITVRQDFIRAIEVTEAAAPFTSVNIGDVAVIQRKARTVGLNLGADVTWFLTPVVGVGVATRYVRGYADTTLTDGQPVDLEVGGLQIGFGARVRFR